MNRTTKLTLFLASMLITFSASTAVSDSQEIVKITHFNTNRIELLDLGNVHFYTIIIPSGGYFLDALPEKIHVSQKDKVSKENPAKRKALIQSIRTHKVQVEKRIIDYLYTLSIYLALFCSLIFVYALFGIFSGDQIPPRDWLPFVIPWLLSLLFYYNYAPLYIDNASDNTFQILLDNDIKLELPPYSFTSQLVSIGTHQIKTVNSKTGNILESSFIHVTYSQFGLVKWLTYMVYNIGQYNSYRIETGYYAP